MSGGLNVLKELRDLKPMTISLWSVTLVASTILTLSLGLTILGVQATDKQTAEQFSSIGGMQISFSSLAVLLCIPSVVRLAIRRDSRRIALWQLIGASPRAARARYISLAAASSLAGAVGGGGIGYLLWPVFGRTIEKSGLLSVPGLSGSLTLWAPLGGILISFIVLLCALLLGTRALKKIEPVEAVSDTPDAPPSRSIGKVLWTLVLTTGVIAGYIGIATTQPMSDPETLGGLVAAYWGTGLGLIIAYGISDRIFIRPVVWLIGTLVPLGRFDAWALAKTSARRRSVLSTSVITPLVVASTSIGCIFGMINQTKNVLVATGSSVDDLQISPSSQIFLVFGSPVAIAAVAGILSVYLTNEWRAHDIALLQTLGVSVSALRWAAVCECIIYFLSASLISLVLLSINAIAIGWALGNGPIPGAGITWFGNETFYLLVAGFSLLTISVVIPTIAKSRTIHLNAITH